MKIKLAAAALATLAVSLPSAPALADGPRASSSNAIVQPVEKQTSHAPAAPHYEWQYHYVGRHPRFEGHWVLVQ